MALCGLWKDCLSFVLFVKSHQSFQQVETWLRPTATCRGSTSRDLFFRNKDWKLAILSSLTSIILIPSHGAPSWGVVVFWVFLFYNVFIGEGVSKGKGFGGVRGPIQHNVEVFAPWEETGEPGENPLGNWEDVFGWGICGGTWYTHSSVVVKT